MSVEIPDSLGKLVSDRINNIPDFPKPGILFRDFSPLLADGKAFGQLIRGLADAYRGHIDAVAGLESRGFLLAAPLAVELEIPMLMIRKAGKLPGPLIGVSYELEYGEATLEMRPDTVKAGSSVLVLDDVLATGGTAGAAQHLLEKAGAHVHSICVLMELEALKGRENLSGVEVHSLVTF